MNLFVKIFLWFLAAIAAMIGMMFFLNWTVQTEPGGRSWRSAIRNETNLWADTSAQIFGAQGSDGLQTFLERVRKPQSVGEVDLIDASGKGWLTEGIDGTQYGDVYSQTVQSDEVQIISQPESFLSTRRVTIDGKMYAFIVRWERPKFTPFFGEAPWRYLRYGVLVLTALLLCWALARYIASPIGKIRAATRSLADGELDTRIGGQVGRRGDELSSLARDFDTMAERIESLVMSQKRLSRDVSHELRSPLARMSVALEIAKQRSNGERSPLFDRIESESQRLNDMISRLLTLSKLETGSKDFDRHEVNLRSVVEQVSADADFEASAKGRHVSVNLADDCRVFGSESLLRSAVENVLRNAVRYTKEGTSVEVSLSNGNGRAVIAIADHGTGVPEAELENLFKPFYRVGEARDRGSGGTGLGLAIAEQAVIAHQGTISARNEGDGLVVEMSLPVMAKEQSRPRA